MTAPMVRSRSTMIDGIWRTTRSDTAPPVDPGDGGNGGLGFGFANIPFNLGDDPQPAIPSARTVFLENRAVWVPLTGAISARLVNYLDGTDGPAGSRLIAEWHDGTTWQPMAVGDVFIALDQGADDAKKGATIAVSGLFDAPVRLVRDGGNNSTVLTHSSVHLQIFYGPTVTTPPAGPCENIIDVDWSAYPGATPADRWAAAQADSPPWTLTDPDGVVVAIGIVNTPTVGGQTASLHLQIAGAGGTSSFSVQRDYTVPAGNYSVTGAVRPENVAGDLTGAPENQWTTATLPQASVGTTLALSATGQATVTGSPTGDLYYAGPSVAPECAGGEPPGTVPPPPAALGGVFGIFTADGDPDVIPPWNAGILVVTAATIIAKLNAARAAGQRVLIQLSGQGKGGPLFDGGVFSEQNYNAIIDAYAGVDISSYSDVVIGLYLIDEFRLVDRWGMEIPDVVINRLAGRALATIVGIPLVYVRMTATQMEEKGFTWTNVNGCWCQFVSNRGPIQTYISQNRASANRQGLRIMWGLNILNGGDGTSGIRGTGEPGLQSNSEMTAAEVTTYGNAMVAAILAGVGDGIFCWRYRSSFLGRTGMSAALTALGNSIP